MLHASMVELSRCMTVSEVCKSAVTFAINRMGIDRMAVFLTDEACSYIQGTWGTDIQGNIVDDPISVVQRMKMTLSTLPKCTQTKWCLKRVFPSITTVKLSVMVGRR